MCVCVSGLSQTSNSSVLISASEAVNFSLKHHVAALRSPSPAAPTPFSNVSSTWASRVFSPGSVSCWEPRAFSLLHFRRTNCPQRRCPMGAPKSWSSSRECVVQQPHPNRLTSFGSSARRLGHSAQLTGSPLIGKFKLRSQRVRWPLRVQLQHV